MAKRKIRVNAVAPGFIATDMIEGLTEKITPYIPMGRIGDSSEVAAAVEFLLSDKAAYITGQVLFLA